MEAKDLKVYLERVFVDNYKEKFGRIIQPNEFSVSTLVAGPGSAIRYRGVSYDPNAERAFNAYFFRGTAIHDLVDKKLAPREWLVGMELSMEFDGLKVYGHPDAVSYGTVESDLKIPPCLLEFKTFESDDINYRKTVLKKAKFQAGCYAKMLAEYDEEYYEAYVIMFDFVRKTPLTDEQLAAGVGLRNGLIEVKINDLDRQYKALINDQMIVFKLLPDEIEHGYNYCRWAAREAWKRMNVET